MQIKRMAEYALFWLPIFGGILLGGIAINAWYSGSKLVALWTGFFGLICFLLLAAVQAHQAIIKSQANPRLPSEDEIKRQRAYLVLDPEKVLELLRVTVGEEPQFMLRIKNVGQSPAYKVGVDRGCGSGPWPPPADTNFTITPTGEGKNVLQPGQVEFWGSDVTNKGKTVTQAEFDAFKTGTLRFYVFGRIVYRDIYDIQRHTNFCLSVVPPTHPQSAGGFGIQRCTMHNDSS
jgi:hypothetical protein